MEIFTFTETIVTGFNVVRALRLGWARGPSAAARTVWEPSAQAWEVAAWEIAHLGSCHLGKYPWEVVTWEKSFGKVPAIYILRAWLLCLPASLSVCYSACLHV